MLGSQALRANSVAEAQAETEAAAAAAAAAKAQEQGGRASKGHQFKSTTELRRSLVM
jgi:hypothetical protein